MGTSREITGGLVSQVFSVQTSKSTEVTVKNTPINILEMEDVLFHHDSAVMMPDKPIGVSAKDGTQNDSANSGDQETQQKQEQASGLNALALVFKESEFNPEQRLLVAGHTDSSGGFALNFELSALRAKNILFLLLGNDPQKKDAQDEGAEWALLSAKRHKIEDYQQILKYFVQKGFVSINCDPIEVNNTWNKNTENASISFFNERLPIIAEELKQKIKTDSQHKWP